MILEFWNLSAIPAQQIVSNPWVMTKYTDMCEGLNFFTDFEGLSHEMYAIFFSLANL